MQTDSVKTTDQAPLDSRSFPSIFRHLCLGFSFFSTTFSDPCLDPLSRVFILISIFFYLNLREDRLLLCLAHARRPERTKPFDIERRCGIPKEEKRERYNDEIVASGLELYRNELL